MENNDRGFKKLLVWQRGYEFALLIYKRTITFPKHEIFGVTSQIRRAAISVCANIAEGYERQHRGEYLQFLFIAKGSLGEIETYLPIARELNYLDVESFWELEARRTEVARLLIGLIKSLS